jgi:hypothetical protein
MLEPSANALAEVVVVPAKFRTHYTLLGNDLKAREEEHERDRTMKRTEPRARQSSPEDGG